MAVNKNNSKTMEANHRGLSFLATLLFAVLCFFIAFPLLAGLLASFRPGRELVQNGLAINWDFRTMTLDNYLYLFGLGGGNSKIDSAKYFMWYKNSLILTILTVVLTLLVCYFVAYGLTMYKFRLQGFLFFMVIATMCVPFEILMLPLYQEVTTLHIINTRAGVILPGLCAASTIFFFRQYMQGLPMELLDAARIDGCTEYGISVRIMMPITKPAFASMAILCAMGSWNNMLWPMLVFRDTNKFTLQIGLNTLLTPYGNNYDLLIAGSMFGIIPILAIYLIFQKYLIDGMTAGAVTG
jgi:arabinosaccharide transport system permease protein